MKKVNITMDELEVEASLIKGAIYGLQEVCDRYVERDSWEELNKFDGLFCAVVSLIEQHFTHMTDYSERLRNGKRQRT